MIILSPEDAEKAARALPYLRAHNLPTEIDERVAAFVARPCTSCGGHAWMIDDSGLLICPCILAKRGEQPAPRIEKPSVETSSRDAWDNRAEYAVAPKKKKSA